jgi:hypothetical protein
MKLTKRRKEKIQINENRDGKRRYYNWHQWKSEDHTITFWKSILQGTGKSRKNKFLKTYTQTKLNQEDIKNLNISVTSNEINSYLKNLPTKKSPHPG